jgi:hypothetical protein
MPPHPDKKLAYLTHVPKVTTTFVMSPQPTLSPSLLIKKMCTWIVSHTNNVSNSS